VWTDKEKERKSERTKSQERTKGKAKLKRKGKRKRKRLEARKNLPIKDSWHDGLLYSPDHRTPTTDLGLSTRVLMFEFVRLVTGTFS